MRQCHQSHGLGLAAALACAIGLPPAAADEPAARHGATAQQVVVVRNDPNEQEHVILYDPSSDD